MILSMVDVKDLGGDAMFNQAAFQQSRLHDLFSRIDQLDGNIFLVDIDTGNWRFESIFNHLNSVVTTISPKLKATELKFLGSYRRYIRDYMELKPIFIDSKHISFNGKGGGKSPHNENRNKISDLLFDYRIQVEKLMDLHGLSNPNKESEAGWD